MLLLIILPCCLLSCVCFSLSFKWERTNEFFLMAGIIFISISCGTLSHILNYKEPKPMITMESFIDIGEWYKYSSPLSIND